MLTWKQFENSGIQLHFCIKFNSYLSLRKKNLLPYFPVLVLIGARQTGKTTLPKNLLPEHREGGVG